MQNPPCRKHGKSTPPFKNSSSSLYLSFFFNTKNVEFFLLLGGHIQRETRKYLSESTYSSIFRPSILHSYSCFSRREAHKGATACPTTPSIVCCSSWGKRSVWEPVPWDRDSICRLEHATLYREPPRHPCSVESLRS